MLNYLYVSMNLPLRLSAASGTGVCTITAYVDASYGVHSNDGKGNSGILTSIGSGPVFAKSSNTGLGNYMFFPAVRVTSAIIHTFSGFSHFSGFY